MKELFIDGQLVDLGQSDKPIPLQKAVNKVGDPDKRSTTVSNIFTLPWSETNRLIFGFLDISAIRNRQPYRKLSAKLIQNGQELISQGICEVQDYDHNGIQVMVYDSIVDLFEYLASKKLSDLNLRQYDHLYTMETIRQSQPNTSGYKYPVIGYSDFPASFEDGYRYLSYKLFRPAFFVKTLFKEILLQAGYTYSGTLFDENRFNLELIPFTNDLFRKPQDFDFTSESAEVEQYPGDFYKRTIGVDKAQYVISMNNIISDPKGHWNGSEYTATSEVAVDASMKFTLKMYSEIAAGSTNQFWMNLIWQQKKAGEQEWSNVYSEEFSNTRGREDEFFRDRQLRFEPVLRPGDKIRVIAETNIINLNNSYMDFWILQGSRIVISAKEDGLKYGELVSVSANLPDMTQKDFIKDIWQRYCYTPVEDKNRKHLYFRHFSELYVNKATAIDWTDKLLDIIPKVSFKLSDKYGQTSYCKYKKDDAVPESLGLGKIIVQNELIPSETTIITSVFAASDTVIRGGGLMMADIKKVDQPDHDNDEYDFSVDTEPRILLDRIVIENKILLKHGSVREETSDSGPMSFPLFSIDNGPSLSFSSLIEEYFNELKLMLNETRVEVHYALLNENDLVNLDFFTPIYDRTSSQNYYLNQIQNYIEGEPCKVELVKM